MASVQGVEAAGQHDDARRHSSVLAEDVDGNVGKAQQGAGGLGDAEDIVDGGIQERLCTAVSRMEQKTVLGHIVTLFPSEMHPSAPASRPWAEARP